MEEVFLPGIYAPNWYSNKSLTWRQKLTIQSRNAIRVGAPRMRQLRVKENTCRLPGSFAGTIDHCRDNYNWVDDDTKDYKLGWVRNGKKKQSSALDDAANYTLPVGGDNSTNTSTPYDDSFYSDVPKFIKSKYKCRNPWCYQVFLFSSCFHLYFTSIMVYNF